VRNVAGAKVCGGQAGEELPSLLQRQQTAQCARGIPTW
jgi:hypothetical protein